MSYFGLITEDWWLILLAYIGTPLLAAFLFAPLLWLPDLTRLPGVARLLRGVASRANTTARHGGAR